LNDSKQLYQKNVWGREIQKLLTQRTQSSLKSAQQLIPLRTSRLFFATFAVKGFLFD
jgi:hypothetical protein